MGNWADWLTGTYQLGELVRRPGGPPYVRCWSRSNDLPR